MKRLLMVLSGMLVCVWFVSCNSSKEAKPIQVVAHDFTFDSPDSISSGWTTFDFHNNGHTTHFFLLSRLPDSASYDMYINDVAMPFQVVMDSLMTGMGKDQATNMLVNLIPAWFFTGVKQMGGSGLIHKGGTCQVTLNLVPGTYAMECYLKEGGAFHSTMGMIKPIVVTQDVSETNLPKANVDITLSNYKIDTQGSPQAGNNTFKVYFKEQPKVGQGNDVHIVRVDDSTHLDKIIHWLDWMNTDGLQSPAPAKFYGGVQEMPAGDSAYFTVNLDPGHYAWIAESAADKGMVKEFTVQ